MKLALQIVSWLTTISSALVILSSQGNIYVILGGAWFLTQGVLALAYVAKKEK